ncbi:MAG: extracellular solute-binding protein [Fimbriimonadaceae bacterium]|nr:extracellular solute-binding protein [Fimbriimonadaceae bacterium]
MKWISSILAASLAVLACTQAFAQQAEGADRPVTVNVWGLGQSPDDKGLADTLREFERQNPNIRVRPLSMGAGGMNPQKLMTAIVGGVPPDIVRQDRFNISDWAARGAFRSLDDLIERDRATDPRTPTPDQYYPAVWEEASYNGKVYGIPIGADNRVLYWNREVFREKAAELRAAGLDPNRAPRTWSETLAYSRVLTEFNPDGTLKRAGFLPNFGNSWLYMFAFQMNASFLSEDGRTCTLHTPESEAALRYMLEGYEIVGGFQKADRFQSTFRGAENDPFLTGQVAMVINGDWVISGYFRYKPGLDFATAPAPVPDDRFHRRGAFANEPDQYITWAGGFAYAIPRGAKNVEEAWKFIKFITSTEGRKLSMSAQQKFEQQRGRRFIPGISGHRETNRIIRERYATLDTPFDQALRTHVSMMDFARIRPATFAAQALWDNHVRAADRALRGFDTPEDALKTGAAAVQRLLDEEFEKEKYPEVNLAVPVWIGIGAIGLVIFGFLGYVFAYRQGPLGKRETAWGYLFISPWILGFLIFTIGPMVASLFFAFTQYNVLTEARWVGWKNFDDVLNVDRDLLLKAFGNIGYLASLGIPLGLVTGLGIAMLLNADIKGMRFYRTAFYVPTVVPGVVSIILWMWLLNADPNRGFFNMLWQNSFSQWFGTPTPNWFGDAYWTKPALIMMGLWGAGGGMILWLAGLKGIPKTLYEASSLDGANPNQQFWNVTIPMLSPLIFFNLVMGGIGAVQMFDNVYIITGGQGSGPDDSLLVPVYQLFINGFTYFRMGYASALAWVIFVVVLAITAVQFLLSRRWVHMETDK